MEIDSRMAKTQMSTSTPNGDITYASQLSIESNPPIDAFNRDAIGRRSISEKHKTGLDAKETGTYQRNKKLREERERQKQCALSGSMESLADAKRVSIGKPTNDLLRHEAMDKLGDLGPSLGMKKSSSLESLQTMVQEIQMSDEPRGPVSLKTPRGRGREELVRAAVEVDQSRKFSEPRKHWLLEDGTTNDAEGGFAMNRNGPFQSSLNDGKVKAAVAQRQKKSSLLKGIGHMFRFGKHRKDGVAPVVTTLPATIIKDKAPAAGVEIINGWEAKNDASRMTQTQTLPSANHSHQRSLPASMPSAATLAANTNTSSSNNSSSVSKDMRLKGPPQYVSPPNPTTSTPTTTNSPPTLNGAPTAIHQNDVFNHRYSHYVNYDELQHHIK